MDAYFPPGPERPSRVQRKAAAAELGGRSDGAFPADQRGGLHDGLGLDARLQVIQSTPGASPEEDVITNEVRDLLAPKQILRSALNDNQPALQTAPDFEEPEITVPISAILTTQLLEAARPKERARGQCAS